MMIYKDILKQLSDAGWSSYRLIKERVISNGTICRLRAKQSVSTETIEVVCSLLHCQPNDILEHIDN